MLCEVDVIVWILRMNVRVWAQGLWNVPKDYPSMLSWGSRARDNAVFFKSVRGSKKLGKGFQTLFRAEDDG
jgi:hypothetical protein